MLGFALKKKLLKKKYLFRFKKSKKKKKNFFFFFFDEKHKIEFLMNVLIKIKKKNQKKTKQLF